MPEYCQQFPKKELFSISDVRRKKQGKLIVFILDFSFSGQKFIAEEQKIIGEEKDINSSWEPWVSKDNNS